jgi:hypothetical protein
VATTAVERIQLVAAFAVHCIRTYGRYPVIREAVAPELGIWINPTWTACAGCWKSSQLAIEHRASGVFDPSKRFLGRLL